MLTAAVLWGLQTSQARIDVREPAAVGSVMAERLGRQFGVRIHAGEGIADVPLIFAVKGVTFDEFRALSADGLDATWRPVREGWELYRTKQQIEEEERRTLFRRSAQIKKGIAELRKEPSIGQEALDRLALNVKLAADDDVQGHVYDENIVTTESLTYDIWTELGGTYFASIPIDTRLVFTSDGRKGTKKMGALTDLMRRLRGERERVIRAFKSSGAWERLASSANGLSPDEFLSLLGVGEADWLLLGVSSTFEGVTLSIAGFDSTGKQTLIYEDNVGYDGESTSRAIEMLPEGQFSLSEQSIKARYGFERIVALDDQKARSALYDVITHLDERDFLSFDTSDVLFEIARVTDRPLIGRLSDDLPDSLGFYGLGREDSPRVEKLSLRAVAEWVDRHNTIEKTASGSIRVSPECAPRYQDVFQRSAIAEYARANKGKRLIDVERAAALFAVPRSLDADSQAAVALFVHSDPESVFPTIFPIVAAYSALTPQQRERAATQSGLNLPLSSLAEVLQQQFQSSAVRYGKWTMFGQLESAPRHLWDRSGQDVGAEWILTDVAENALQGMKVNVKATSGPRALARTPRNSRGDLALTAQSLAEWAYQMESGANEKARQDFELLKFDLEEFVTIEIRYETPMGTMLAKTSVQVTEGGLRGLSIEQLPGPFLAEFNRHLTELRKGGGQPTAR